MRKISETISEFVVNLKMQTVPDVLSREVGRAIIDTVGTGLAGCQEPASRITFDYVKDVTSSHQAVLWGRAQALALESAVLYNGVAAHVLDYDDVTSPLRGHPSIALLPPLLALGQVHRLPGRQLVLGYIAGFEVMVRIAKAMISDHYSKGWHATTTLGTIGAAVACAKLLDLSKTEVVNAIGLAVAQASGTRANFGTMAKSFQTGHCAAAGLRACLLAQLGMDASEMALDSSQGFMTLYGEGESLTEHFSTLGQAPLELASSGLEIKKYPLCYATHRALDGILDLIKEHGLTHDQVESVHVTSNAQAMVPLIHSHPRTGLQGKFSMEYAMSAALLDGAVNLASFTDQAVLRPQAQALIKRVTKQQAQGEPFPRWNVVHVRTKGGSEYETRIETLRGSMEHPLTDAQLKEKWDDCLKFPSLMQGHPPSQAAGDVFYEKALQIEKQDIARLMDALPAVM